MTPLLLANENIPAPSVDYLRAQGYDVRAIAESDASLRDLDVLRIAVAEHRWILTFDRDYGELIFARGMPIPPAVVFLRLASYRPEEPGRILVDLLSEEIEMLGQFVVVEDHGLRKRPLPSRTSA